MRIRSHSFSHSFSFSHSAPPHIPGSALALYTPRIQSRFRSSLISHFAFCSISRSNRMRCAMFRTCIVVWDSFRPLTLSFSSALHFIRSFSLSLFLCLSVSRSVSLPSRLLFVVCCFSPALLSALCSLASLLVCVLARFF